MIELSFPTRGMSDTFTPTKLRLTVAQYHRMGEAGIFAPDARLELIEGEVIEMPPIGPPHAVLVTRLTRFLVTAVGDAAVVWVQLPVVLDNFSEPQPDVALLDKSVDTLPGRLPTVDDALLVIEVSDTTLSYDRGRKLSLYARHGVREVWIVDIRSRVVEVYRDPVNDAYRLDRRAGASETLSPVALPGVEVSLAALFAS
ncbi:MAG TPA: Uma2 family endonuclease [Casimicrobiaceae bacterium]|jgi:Uma2 family endonuclease